MTKAANQPILIIGAGLVGLTMANLLAKQGFSVRIIDKEAPDTSYDDAIGLRVSAINKTSQKLFEDLGLWSAMQNLRMGPYERMLVWDEGSEAHIEMDAAEVGETTLGFIIENHLMLKVLFEGLEAYPKEQVQFILDTPIALKEHNTGWELELASGQIIEASLLIAADGSKSWVRSAVHIESSTHDFQQQALVCTVRCEKPHRFTARQRFLESGPLAFLPLHDSHLCSIVWSTSKEQAENLAGLPDDEFNTALEKAFWIPGSAERPQDDSSTSVGIQTSALGKLQVIGFRAHYPLSQHHAKHYVKKGLALIGDAAHSIHPLAGQGVNLGFADAKALAEVLTQAKLKGRTIASESTLLQYQRSRKHYNAAIMWSMYGFNTLFSNRLATLARLREIGVNAVDKQSFIKRFFIKQAMDS
ncbi:MAG: UbiH/UbiF/VisC/COQ6 family ubiquinone biosynthesis hydroxylase [Gammaproteobacteria bacterium]|nr:UbiH/UbiF/VisC/COQ6 family ubiquinone biosynthesis hydroxylase [Gammaproteobacteria bacterium]